MNTPSKYGENKISPMLDHPLCKNWESMLITASGFSSLYKFVVISDEGF